MVNYSTILCVACRLVEAGARLHSMQVLWIHNWLSLATVFSLKSLTHKSIYICVQFSDYVFVCSLESFEHASASNASRNVAETSVHKWYDDFTLRTFADNLDQLCLDLYRINSLTVNPRRWNQSFRRFVDKQVPLMVVQSFSVLQWAR